MSHTVEIHSAQTTIVRALLFAPSKRFSELQRETGLESKHANFHIKRLIKLGFVEKKEAGEYALTAEGKEHANKLDTDTNTIERQPKVSVILILKRTNKDGQEEQLFQQRLKNPFFGYWGRLGGKMRWGESLGEAAARELEEETGLHADFDFGMLYHKRDINERTGQVLEDKMFMIMVAKNISGDFMEEFEGGFNKWMTINELKSQDKYFESAVQFHELLETGSTFAEEEFQIDPKNY